MAAEAVKVIVRCRPMNEREKNLNCKMVVTMDGIRAQCSIVHPNDKKNVKTFTFDGAYFVDSTTEQIYADIGYPLVEGVTEGYNGTIFAYGQTGCGKSFSMQGIQNPTTQRGIIPRAFDHIFETIMSMDNVKYLVHASYLEIYNEEIRDLLGKDVKQKLDLKEHPEKGVYVQGLSMHPCKNVKDCEHIMDRGWKNRATGATLMNADSSRSHSIFTVHIEMCEPDETGEEHIRAGKLNLVDLAGSERQAKTGATGSRLKEATKINLSLSALGNVISALVDGKSKHIPYRDSKLTRLLQDSLGGNTKTLMVACLSPADNNYDETLSTLRYANRAKNIKNKPKINEDPKDAMLREYQDEITRLKAMLRGEIPIELDGISAANAIAPKVEKEIIEKVVHVTNDEEMEAEKQRIREEYEDKMATMQQEFDAMRINKEKMEEEISKMRDHYDEEIASVEAQVVSPNQSGTSVSAPVAPVVAAAVVANGNGSQTQVVPSEAVPSQTSLRPAPSHASQASPGAQDELVSVTGSDTSMPVPVDDESQYLQQQPGQQAVHLGSELTGEGMVAPSSSPTEHSSQADMLKHEEALRRLQELQEQMVGGEQANNQEVKESRKRKKKHAEERKRKLEQALANMDGEEIMLNIYDNVQDELKAKSKVLEKAKRKVTDLEQEVVDLQAEFEFDRIDYLDTIRKQERQVKLLQGIIDKIHPCIRRDCNYASLDRVKTQCEWNEDKQTWTLPALTIEKTRLPAAGVMPGGRETAPRGRPPPAVNGDPADDKYLQKLQNSTEQDIANNYFRNKRADRLLTKSQEDKSRVLRNASPRNDFHQVNGTVNGHHGNPWQNDPMPQDSLRAAYVHGQYNGEDYGIRKPMRLESLPQPSARSRKKKKLYNTMEQL